MSKESIMIPRDDLTVRMLRSFSTRWSVMSATLSVKGVISANKAKNVLHSKHMLLAQKMLPHLNADQKLSLVEEIVEEDALLFDKYFTREVGTESLREAMQRKMAPPVLTQTHVSMVPEVVVSGTPSPLGPNSNTIHVDVDLSTDEEGGLAVESLTYHGVSEDGGDEEQISQSLCEEVYLLDETRFELIDPSEASIIDLEREEKTGTEGALLTDEEMDSVVATFALKGIERFKPFFISPMVNNAFVERLQMIEPRMDRESAFRLITLLKQRAGTRFIEEMDDDIPF